MGWERNAEEKTKEGEGMKWIKERRRGREGGNDHGMDK
jgi:hypothetical protein